MFLFGRKKKVQKELEEKYKAFEMSYENNYKDLAMIQLREYEELLERCYEDKRIDETLYQAKKSLVKEKQEKLKNFNHKQRIGW